MNNLIGMDLVPDPKIISAALRACRRVNDYALTTRFLEAVKFRCQVNKELYPYIIKVRSYYYEAKCELFE
jgi:cytochrome c oxidase subunit 5a